MSQTNLKVRFALTLLIFSSMPWDTARSQDSAAAEPTEAKFLDVTVPEFQIHNQNLLDATWKLARGPVPFAFGFEKILKTKLTDLDIADPLLNLELKNVSVRQILDALCQADSRYNWSIDRTTVNLFPEVVTTNPAYLLDRRFTKFELKNATDPQDGLLAIVRQLPPPKEQIAEAQVGGADTYPPEPWTVIPEDVSVRQVANRLAARGGPCGIWIFGGAQDFRAFGFFNTYLNCTKIPDEQTSGRGRGWPSISGKSLSRRVSHAFELNPGWPIFRASRKVGLTRNVFCWSFKISTANLSSFRPSVQ
jgi:hypothetical protein